MEDSLRPSKEAFEYTLRASYQLWSTHFNTSDTRLPLECVDLKSLLKDTPAFLADGLIPSDRVFSFTCAKNRDNLEIKGRSRWQTSKAGADCITPSKVIPMGLPLGVAEARKVELSKDAPLSKWPGVRGISGYDEGNQVAVLFMAWAYILSAKWAELLDRSEKHQCSTKYSSETCQEPEARSYINAGETRNPSPVDNVQASIINNSLPIPHPLLRPPPPLRTMHSSAISIVFMRDSFFREPLALPIPRPAKNPKYHSTQTSPQSISALISEHEKLLPYYMTLSSKMWLTTLPAVKSTFFNPDIPCNLVSAWKNPAFAVINPIIKQNNIPRLLNGLSARQPRVASLWLGAVIMGRSSTYLKQCEQGMTAPSLEAEAWMGVTATFLTQQPGTYDTDADSVRREDECRLLFLATPTDGSYNHGYVTSWQWKPFGSTKVCDTDILLREHLGCGCHVLEYEGWDWELGDGSRVEDTGVEARFASLLPTSNCASASESVPAPFPMCVSCPKPGVTSADLPALPKDCEYDLYSDRKSDNPTRGIFCWLRSDGFPSNEKRIYQHSWIVIADDSDEEVDERESDDSTAGARAERVEDWLGGVIDVDVVVEVQTESCR
ncbi:hypothetical protein ACN42_g7050 [Penicillium freii]|uniref:Uncharacterized protein n=1 Tax=Penicillium freii TaxID=48697 RepID=A0A101MGB5_PENFR|nr:hypothetical protein ACN42_g7050 [Penicillium freii]